MPADPHCSTPHQTQPCPMALQLSLTDRFLPSANLKHATVLVQNHLLPVELLPMPWHLLEGDRGTFLCNPLAVEVSNPPCPLPEGTIQQSKTKEKRAQSSALPLGTHRGCSVKNPSSVHNPGTQARAALQTSPVTLAGRQQLGFMKNGSCDIWLFAETDVFS